MKVFLSWKIFPPIICFILFCLLPIGLNDIENYNDIVGYSIGLGSSSLGFFVAAVALLQSGSFSRFMQITIDLGTDKKIIRWLMTSILYSFIFSFVGLFALMLKGLSSWLDKFLFSLWLSSLSGVIIAGGVTVFSLFALFIIKDKPKNQSN